MMINKSSTYNKIPLVNLLHTSRDWWFDSGANVHVCANRSLFSNFQDSSGNVTLGNGSSSQVIGQGQINLVMSFGKELILHNVLYIPGISKNLVSGSLLVQRGYKFVLESNKVIITKGDLFIGKGYVVNGLFKLNTMFASSNEINSAPSFSDSNSILWHAKFGHVHLHRIKEMMDLALIPKSKIDFSNKCEICTESKQPRKPYNNVNRETKPLELIHTDVCDSTKIPARGGNRYFVTFIDDYSKFCDCCLLKSKDQVFDKFKTFKAKVENQLQRKIKIVRSDCGGEYSSNEFTIFCEENRIIHEVAALYSPQFNGVAKRKKSHNIIYD